MHTYRRNSRENLWTVGFEQEHAEYDNWGAIKDFGSEYAAAQFTSWLNGGGSPSESVLDEAFGKRR